ncbi:hemerythrin domain-containing protein [Gordonia humi]|uniref:Iron-sulfur cluster repair protein YtfE (RIC family) n=1 Tax=Gordonia humi TaxID=686429 RepID=A0A840FB62_9ACTN|nr:hemerythrin domain-containing protein [Gordonia humi]MBB4137380.1 iron-sulfur cluster repair protein YtfE (RIC family) [Gordonia humi]
MPESASLAQLLEAEHREIDAGIAAYTADPAHGAAALRTAVDSLRRHIYLEEEFCFDALRERGLMMPVMVMLREHGEIWALCDHAVAALDSCEDSSRSAHRLLAVLDAHNGKEEPVLYPHIGEAIGDDASADLLDFLDTGTMPDGWVCATAT